MVHPSLDHPFFQFIGLFRQLFLNSTFDVGRSMFDVHFFSSTALQSFAIRYSLLIIRYSKNVTVQPVLDRITGLTGIFFHPVDLSIYILDLKFQILLQFLNHD